jgi:methyl-accepting chemotaxis protein
MTSDATKPVPKTGSAWHWLKHGEQLMGRMNVPVKLTLIAASVILPLIAMYSSVLKDRIEAIRYIEAEIASVRIEQQLPTLLMSRDQVAQEPLSRLVAAASDTEAFSIAEEIQALKQVGGMSSRDPVQHQTALVSAIESISLMSAERSGLVLDPEAKSYFLMDAMVNAVQPAMRMLTLMQATANAGQALGSGQSSTAELPQIASVVRFNVSQATAKLSAYERAGGQRLPAMLVVAQAVQGVGLVQGPAGVQERDRALNALVQLHQAITIELEATLRDRWERTVQRMLLETAAFVLGMLLLGYFLWSFVSSFRRSVRTLTVWIRDIASGDLAARPVVDGRDELARLGQGVGHMTDRLSALVAEIRNSATMVNMTGEYVAKGSARLAHRTEEQASSLRSSVSAISQLSAAVDQNAHSAASLNGLTEELKGTAEHGLSAMAESVQAMVAMQAASSEVADIVMVLDDIAFQTTMLSLNASIEASKAGDAGKGFGVVAISVKELAQRCGEATERIRKLTVVNARQAEESRLRLDVTSQALDRIVDGVRNVSTQLQVISDSTAQQSCGLQEVQHSVGCLDDITRQNAALVEQSSTASNALMMRAGTLRQSVASMRLLQGSPEEALTLVNKGRQALSTLGRHKALEAFHDPAGGFIDRDLYLFAFDRNGICLALGAQPRHIGAHIADIPGLSLKFLEDGWRAADAGGGWINYQFLNPVTREVCWKESYVVQADQGLFMGCGVYKQVNETSGLGMAMDDG